MHVVFGRDLDGGSYPEIVGSGTARLGAAIVGPLGVASLLETQLGLGGPEVVPAVRMAQYLARLRTIVEPGVFFEASFEADAWATARCLLEWRDTLVASGWNGKAIPDG